MLVSFLCIVLVCAGCREHSYVNQNMASISEGYEDEKEGRNYTEILEDDKEGGNYTEILEDDKEGGNHTETSEDDTESGNYAETLEDIQQFFHTITGDMLNGLESYPSLDAYWHDTLVLLNQFNQNVRLYGININEKTAMLLYIGGEKILIEEEPFPSFQNLYQERPKLNVFDADNDGVEEIVISLRSVTGSISRYDMLVCDYEDEWHVYMYKNYLEDIKNIIQYRYDDKNNIMVFLDNKDNILWEGKLPEWTDEYAYQGVVNFGDMVEFDAEAFQMHIVPQIALENSLPYEPIRITFNLSFINGHFKIEDYDIDICTSADAICN